MSSPLFLLLTTQHHGHNEYNYIVKPISKILFVKRSCLLNFDLQQRCFCHRKISLVFQFANTSPLLHVGPPTVHVLLSSQMVVPYVFSTSMD